MTPIEFPQVNRRWAENQDEHRTLPAYTDDEQTISCWRLSWRERLRLLFSGKLWLRQINYGAALQPQLPQIETPFEE